MILSKSELLDLFEDVYQTDKQIEMLRKDNKDKLSGFAEANDFNKKSLLQAFASYKAYKDGKIDSRDEDYFSMLAIIEEHFNGDEDSNSSDDIAM